MNRMCLLLSALLLGCIDAGNIGPGEKASLTGAWTGPVRVALGPDTLNAPLALQLHQSANSGAITGTLSFTPLGDQRPITGELKDREMTVFTQGEESPEGDCHLYTQRWVFRAYTAELRLTTATGQMCESDGQGGHASLRNITGASGTLLQ